jgi:hypothetical protein
MRKAAALTCRYRGPSARCCVPAALLALMLVCTAAGAWPWDTLEVEGAMIWIGNADPDSAPSPLLPALGLNLPIVAQRRWGFDVGFLVTGLYYEYAGGRAIPAELEHRGYAVPAVLGDARWSLFVPLGQKVRLGFSAGALLFLRVPIPLFPDASADFGQSLLYLLVRSVYPETGLSVRFPLLPAFDLEVGVRAGWPWFHLWDGEPYAFWDQLIVSGVLGVVYKLPAKNKNAGG